MVKQRLVTACGAQYIGEQSGRQNFHVRVLENPSCRWTTWFANAAGIDAPEDVPATVQNRGWSSPIRLQPD